MKFVSAIAAASALASLAVGEAAQAHEFAYRDAVQHDRLPPVSGTIRLSAGGHAARRAADLWYRPGRLARRHYGPLYGYQGGAYRQLWRGGYNTAGSEVFWNRNVEFYGEGNDTLALLATGTGANTRSWRHSWSDRTSDNLDVPRRSRRLASAAMPTVLTPTTGWGTADSATTGGAYPPPSPAHRSSVNLVYGDAGVWDGQRPAYAYPPTGGLGYYNSGSPGRMGYYSSSSSAGPGGSPGGLAIYSSGSYGPGPHVVQLDGQGGRWSGIHSAGPRIIHVHDDQTDN